MKNVVVTLQNPLDKGDTLDYVINVYDTPMGNLWYLALQDVLKRNLYLEKNFCFLGFPNTPRTIEFICDELNKACSQINEFFGDEYYIDEVYTPAFIQHGDLSPNQTAMNLLHNRFENLQGTVWGLSDWYKRADYDTKFAIRQLNNLCHEAESLMLSQRKQIEAPDWIRPSQITTFLNCPRHEFPEEYKKEFDVSRYNRNFGEVYLHWTQIGKTLYEVFRDEHEVELDEATCDAITHLKYYSGEFDIEWAQSVVYGEKCWWHDQEMDAYSKWLMRNNIDLADKSYNYGYHAVGKVDLIKSFNTEDYTQIWDILTGYLNILSISVGDAAATYNYAYTDPDYKHQQIERLKPGYDYSSR